MLLRISLVVALLAGLAGLYFGHIPVAEKIKTLTSERDEARNAQQVAQGAEAKAKAGEKKAKEEADKATKTLAEAQMLLDETKKNYTQQRARADKLFADWTDVSKERNDARVELAGFKNTGWTVDQILEAKNLVKKIGDERDAFVGENKILLRNVNQLQAELSRYVGAKEIPIKLPAGLKGKVLAVDPKYDFVVLDIGETQGVLERGQMLVSRDGKLVGKIRITKVEPNRSIANILPEWKQDEVTEGDLVAYLP